MITEFTKDTLFKPVSTRIESQKSRTDLAAKVILNEEMTASIAKTQRLRAARMARDCAL